MKQKFRDGFTLIELSLSIVFVSILSLMIVLIISNTVESYQKGITLSNINTIGMDLVDDMRLSVQNSPAKSIKRNCEIYMNINNDAIEGACIEDGAYSFVFVNRVVDVDLGNEDSPGVKPIPIYGAFCTGTYTYIWNSGYFWSDKSSKFGDIRPVKFIYRDSEGKREKTDFRLLKVRDGSRAVCVSAAGWQSGIEATYIKQASNNYMSPAFDIHGDDYETILEEPVDLLLDRDSKNNNLALYDLYVAKPAENIYNDNIFYSVSFILGTVRGGIDITANGKNCVAPNEAAGEYFNYCAVNKFNFAAQANGG